MTYFIMYQGRPIGPLNIDQVFGYTRDAATPVSRDGGPWYPLSSYPELAERLARFTPPEPAAEPVQRTVSFGDAITRGFRGFVTFTGRASRSEFWLWFLFYFLINIPLNLWYQSTIDVDVRQELLESLAHGVMPTNFEILSLFTDHGTSFFVSGAIGLLFFLPNLAISIRRMHDTGRSGWWLLLCFILIPLCYLGFLLMLIFYLQPSQPATNKYGPVPNLEY